jgi:3',5'-nucleoside bisphosphate phosphatase
MRIDTHCHTNCSDGAVTIEERVDMARSAGFDAVTITDHDFVSPEQVDRARARCGGLPYVPGIELSLSHEGTTVHLLGFWVNPAAASLRAHVADVEAREREVTEQALALLRRDGLHYSLAELDSGTLHTMYTMQLVRRVAADRFANRREGLLDAFLGWFDELGLRYPDLYPWTVREGIDLVHRAGGIAVLAHPGGETSALMQRLGFRRHTRDDMSRYADWGLDGVEARCPDHTPEERQFFENLAGELGLLATAGSDCHGEDPYLGAAKMGVFTDIPDDLYERMKQRHDRRHSR